MGWEVETDMSGQSNDCPRICNVKMKKIYWGRNRAHFREFMAYGTVASSNLNYFFSKMVKLDEKECLDTKMSDFELFGEVFNCSMFNMSMWFDHILLICEVHSCPILEFEYSFQSLWPTLQESEVIIWAKMSTRGPLRCPKMAKMCPKIADIGNFWTHFCNFWVP